jgi:phosphatidate cytidylyltransferase
LEYTNLNIIQKRDRFSDFLGIISGVSIPPLCYFFGLAAMLPAVIVALFIFFFAGMLRKDFKDAVMDTAIKTLGIIYIAVPLSYVILLRDLEQGRWWLLFILFVIWANDTFAYFTGKTIGRHKMSPFVSPNKTIEGAIGGLAGAVLAGLVMNKYLAMGMTMTEAAALSVILGVMGIIGDLAESLLKRSAGVKDSGSVIPGHGGVLDRIDSLLFPVPFVYYFLIFH